MGHPWGTLGSGCPGRPAEGGRFVELPALLDEVRVGRQREAGAAVAHLLADVEDWLPPGQQEARQAVPQLPDLEAAAHFAPGLAPDVLMLLPE